MFKSNFLIALRNLKKQKAYSLINIIGMAVGMACFTLFAFMAGSKLNADKFHKNADRIYSAVQVLQSENKEEEHLAFIPAPLVEALRSEFPEIEDSARVFPVCFYIRDGSRKSGDCTRRALFDYPVRNCCV